MTVFQMLNRTPLQRLLFIGGAASGESIETVTGNPVTFQTNAEKPLKGLLIPFTPVQSGIGDPSPTNIRPISGWDGANVVRTGVNVWDEEWEVGGIVWGTGQNTSSSTQIRSKNYIPVLPNTTYCFKAPAVNIDIFRYRSDKTFISATTKGSSANTITTPADCYFIRFVPYPAYGTTYNNDISINYPSTDTTYHAYSGNSYSVSFPSTIYGGEIDWVGEKATERVVAYDMGDLDWVYLDAEAGHERFRSSQISEIKSYASSALSGILCSCYKTMTNNDVYVHRQENIIGTGNQLIQVYDSAYTDATAFKNAVKGQKIVCELATPIEIPMSDVQQISTLKGVNNLWSDTNGENVVTYLKKR